MRPGPLPESLPLAGREASDPRTPLRRGSARPGLPGVRAQEAEPGWGTSEPQERAFGSRAARALSLWASPQRGGSLGAQERRGSSDVRRPALRGGCRQGSGRAGAHRKAEDAAHLGARQLGQGPAMLSSLLTKQKRVKGSPRAASPRSVCGRRCCFRAARPGTGRPGSRARAAAVAGLPGAGGEERAAGLLPRPDLPRFPARPVPPPPHNVIVSQPLLVTPALQIVVFSFLPTHESRGRDSAGAPPPSRSLAGPCLTLTLARQAGLWGVRARPGSSGLASLVRLF